MRCLSVYFRSNCIVFFFFTQKTACEMRISDWSSDVCSSDLLMTRVIPIDKILFASEMVGAVRGIDPETGFNFDDTKRYVDQVSWLTDDDQIGRASCRVRVFQ